jgi:NAD(P)-dependent dehydrogenase (short-subunit alcohol dehydrogenase family)
MKQVALLTGSAGGMGRGTARVLAEKGFKVLLLDRNEEKLAKAVKEMEQKGLDVEAWPSDIVDRPKLAKTITEIIAKHGHIDALVNMAGLMPLPCSLTDTDDKLWDDMVAVNFTGTFNVTKAVLPHMIKEKYGRIVNISSISARKTVGYFVGYAAAKGALHAFTTALANEVTGQGITVNCVLPGFTETEEMHRIWGAVAQSSGITEEEILKPFWAQIPIGRWVQPEEIGTAVAFLVSEEARVVTGQILRVDGGYDSHD